MLEAQGYASGIEVQRMLEMRYLGQNYELELPFDADGFTEANTADLWERFHAQHNARFGFAIEGERIETVNMKVALTAVGPKPDLPELPKGASFFDQQQTS